MPPRRALTLALGLVACGPPAGQVAAQRYVAEVGPTLQRNAALARGHAERAQRLRKGALDAEGVARELDEQVIPEARAIVTAGRAIHPDQPALRAAHDQLVEAWSARADAAADLSRAWHASDLPGLDAALKADTSASDAELAGFMAINAQLSGYGVTIDPFGAPSGS